jgi:uncharacterized alpha-E superfamily protein
LRAFQPGFPAAEDARALEAQLERTLEEEHSLGSPAFNQAAVRRAARAVRDLLPDDCWTAVNSLMPPRMGRGRALPPAPAPGILPSASALPPAGALHPTPHDPAGTLRWLDQAVLHLAGLTALESESIALGPVQRFLTLGRSLERSLCAVRLLAAALGGNLKPSEALLKSLLACHDAELTYRQRYHRDLLPGPAADLILADESNPRSVASQLDRFTAELAQLPLADSPMLTVCRKAALKALTQVRLFEAGGPDGIAGAGGNEAFEHLLGSLEEGLGRLSDCLAREFFQPIPLPQSLREWS